MQALTVIARVSRHRTMPFYAVRVGKKPGIYGTWGECQEQVNGFPGSRYKKFSNESDALGFINPGTSASSAGGKLKTSVDPDPGPFTESASSGPSGSALPARPTASGRPISPQHSETYTNQRHLVALKHVVSNMKKSYEQMKQYILQADELIENLQSNSTRPVILNQRMKRSRSVSPDPDSSVTKKSKVGVMQNHQIHTTVFVQHDDGSREDDANRNKLTVFTDGCCVNNGKPNARAGIGVYWGPNNLNNIAQRLTGRQTNNRAEIHAAIQAIRQAKRQGAQQLVIKTDSQFMINSITKWIHKWKSNGWKLANGSAVVNKEDFEELDQVQNGIDVTWVHVRGHQGIVGNEEADRLANEGANKEMSG